jgi:hypothetical protein
MMWKPDAPGFVPPRSRDGTLQSRNADLEDAIMGLMAKNEKRDNRS